MVKKNKCEIVNKQTYIKRYMRNQFLLKNIIDPNGNILDVQRFRTEIANEISKVNQEMDNNTTIDGVVIDRMYQSVLFGELEYLQGLEKHQNNIDEFQEYPKTSYEDLPKKTNYSGFAQKVKDIRLGIQNKIANWLIIR